MAQKARAASREGGPGGGVFRGRNTGTNSELRARQQRVRPPTTTGITAAIASALSETMPEARPRLLEWIAGHALLRLVHAEGREVAAGAAYRLADVLAGPFR
jgi:hypothetical protein